MKIVVLFYSFSGNTERACQFIKKTAAAYSDNVVVDLVSLKPLQEETSFLKQSRQAFLRQGLKLKEVSVDINQYDVIICASPVWAFTYAPALRSYLKEIKNVSGKKGACFVTYHSGLGADRALRELNRDLQSKGAEVAFCVKLSGEKTSSLDYLTMHFSPLLQLLKG